MVGTTDDELPGFCYVTIPGAPPGQKAAYVVRGHSGYWPAEDIPAQTNDESERIVREANEQLGVTPQQAFCMKNGAMLGWDKPGADPEWVRREHPHLLLEETQGSGE